MIALGGVFAMHENLGEMSPDLLEIYNTFTTDPEADLKLEKEPEWYGPVISDYQVKKSKPYVNLGWITDPLTVTFYAERNPDSCVFSIALNLGMFDYAKQVFKGTFYLIKNYIPMQDKIRVLLELKVPLINVYINATLAGDTSIIDYFNEVHPKNAHEHKLLKIGLTGFNQAMFEAYFLTVLKLWVKNNKEPKTKMSFDIFEYYLSNESKPIYLDRNSEDLVDSWGALNDYRCNYVEKAAVLTLLNHLKSSRQHHDIYAEAITIAIKKGDIDAAIYCLQQSILINYWYIQLCIQKRNISILKFILHHFRFTRADLQTQMRMAASNWDEATLLLKGLIETNQCYD